MTTDPDSLATIGYLRENDLRLGLHCLTCARFKYSDLAHFRDADTVTDLSGRLRFVPCPRYGPKNLQTRPIHAVHKDEWPQESSWGWALTG